MHDLTCFQFSDGIPAVEKTLKSMSDADAAGFVMATARYRRTLESV